MKTFSLVSRSLISLCSSQCEIYWQFVHQPQVFIFMVDSIFLVLPGTFQTFSKKVKINKINTVCATCLRGLTGAQICKCCRVFQEVKLSLYIGHTQMLFLFLVFIELQHFNKLGNR
jgi:hypothetical protein